MEKSKLNRLLLGACYEYPPDFEKMQKLVDMGADVNARINDSRGLLFGEMLYFYLSKITGEGVIKYDGISLVEICDILCQGKTVNGRDGRYLFSIIRFFFKNGFCMGNYYHDNGLDKDVFFANDVFSSLHYSFCGDISLKTLKYILSKVSKPEHLYFPDGVSVIDEYGFSLAYDEDCGLTFYSSYLSKACEMIEDFAKKKGWEL